MAVAEPTEAQMQALLRSVRSLTVRQIVLLAGHWAGVSAGTLDPHRQRRRNAARLALRYLESEDGGGSHDTGKAAAAAVADAIAADDPRAGRTLHGPIADATFAVTDALDAIAHADRLTAVARDELFLPWVRLQDEIEGRGE